MEHFLEFVVVHCSDMSGVTRRHFVRVVILGLSLCFTHLETINVASKPSSRRSC